ncbi:MAG: beta galactosidase jelly roll domain-containing protein [Bacteroides sp.]|nr:beta galactosidase jelly roll domain-containing protein [Bacteroides sp.]
MNRIFTTIALILGCLCLPATGRQRETINDNWYFFQGDAPGAEQVNWQKINLPHCWNATDSYQTQDYYRGSGWYRKVITLPERYRGQQIYLRFDGASLRADVYINGKYIGNHKGGYTAFSFDVTEYLHTDRPNVLAVRVDNSEQDIPPLSADFTFFGGIYRDVWLMGVEEVHFDMDNMASPGIFIETLQVSGEAATVRVHGAVTNRSTRERQVVFTREIRDTEKT